MDEDPHFYLFNINLLGTYVHIWQLHINVCDSVRLLVVHCAI